MTRITYVPNRVIDLNGIADGASIYVYQTGTTTPVSLFTDAALTVPASNPYVVASGAAVPPLYTNSAGAIRLYIVSTDGTIQDEDPYYSLIFERDSASALDYTASGSGAVTRTVLAKLREGRISVKDYGAVGDGVTNDTAAINLAIAACSAGKTLYFPPGDYLVSVSDGEKCLTAIPVGVHIYMESEAWLKPSTADATTSVILPLGRNILKVNIDGRSFAEADDVQTGTLINNSQGIRAYANAAHGLGASDVTVIQSRFRNLRYGIQTEGAQRWKILDNRFERIGLSGVLKGSNTGYSCTRNLVQGNDFTSVGDTAVAFYEVIGNTNGELSFNHIDNNTAKDCNLRISGYCYDFELGQVTLQHHNKITNNTYVQTRTIAHALGGVLANSCSYTVVSNNVVQGSMSSSADVGIAVERGKFNLVEGNIVSDWRGGGISTDGCDGVHVSNNYVTNCGGSGNASPIILARNVSTRSASAVGNRITITADYAAYAAGVAAVLVLQASGQVVRDIDVSDNIIDRPNDIGVYVSGGVGATVQNVNIRDNTLIGRESEDAINTHFESFAFILSYCEQATIANNTIYDCRAGFDCRNNTNLTLSDNEFKGTRTIAELYRFASSTGVKVRNSRCYQPVTTVIASAGTGDKYENDDKVKTHAYGTSAAIVTGGTIAHGLAFTPTLVNVLPAAAGPTDVSATADATNITVTFGGGTTTAFYWEARV